MADNESFNIPRPANAAPGLTGQPPLPVGRPMILKSVSPGERAILEELGWQDGQPIPENLGDILKQAKDAAENVDVMPLPGSVDMPKLKMPEEQDIASLAPNEQQRYKEIVQQVMAATAAEYNSQQEQQQAMLDSAGAGVNDAIRAAMTAANDIVLEDDTKSETYATGQPKTPTPPPAKNDKDEEHPTHCPNCGWEVADTDNVVKITNMDITNFLQAVLGGVPFVKKFDFYGGKLSIVVRTLAPPEVDLCFRQRLADLEAGRLPTQADELETLTRYRASMQVVEVHSSDNTIQLPRTLDAWVETIGKEPTVAGETVLPKLWTRFQQMVCKSEMLHRAVMGAVLKFNSTVRRLEENAENENFWQTTD